MKTFRQQILEATEIRFGKESEKGFFGTAGAGVLVVAKDTGRILIGLRSPGVDQPNTWGTIGGAIDGKENPKVAAQREFEEETRYKGKLKLTPAYVFKKGDFKFHNFIGIVPKEFKATPDWENTKFEWFELDNLPKPLHFGLVGLLKNSMTLIRKKIK
jgi:8-oxo-dGTP pyrophosphatase MutT (NUDIX family)